MIQPAQIQVRFADLDLMGHVNNSVYLSYFEYARVQYFNEILGRDWDWNRFGCLVVRNEINYHKSILLNDIPFVTCFLEEIGHKSFTIGYEIKVNDVLTTTGKTVLVCFDPREQRAIEVSDDWRKALIQLEKNSN